MKRIILALIPMACSSSDFGGGTGKNADGGGNPMAECDPGAVECVDSGSIQSCGTDSQWMIVACPSGQLCSTTDAGAACAVPPACVIGQRRCNPIDTSIAEICNTTLTGWDLAEQCGAEDVCSGGLCVSACELAASSDSFIACEFYAYSMDNPEVYTGYNVIAANPGTGSATVTIDVRSGDTWSPVATITVPPNSNLNSTLTPRNVSDTALSEGAAYRVTSTSPILLYQLNGYNYGSGGGSSSGATLLFPTAALGERYYSVNLAQGNQSNYRSNVVVVGTEDDTIITVRVSPDGEIDDGTGVPDGIPPGESDFFTINDGDVLQFASKNSDDDLTGTYVEGSNPVAFFSGHEDGPPSPDATYPLDHYEEQLPSVDKWGVSFVAAKIVGTENPTAPPAWRIVASEDDTLLEFTAGTGTSGLDDSHTLNEGEWYETRANGNFFMTSSDASGGTNSKPVLLVQFVTADTDMVYMPPTEQYLPEYVFANFAGGEVLGTVTVARPVGSETYLDGSPWSAAIWSEAGGGWEVAQTANPVGNHVISLGGTPDPEDALQIWIRGNQGGCTFSYVGGVNLLDINTVD